MNRTKQAIENRIHLLTQRNPGINENIIRKLKRNLKKFS